MGFEPPFQLCRGDQASLQYSCKYSIWSECLSIEKTVSHYHVHKWAPTCKQGVISWHPRLHTHRDDSHMAWFLPPPASIPHEAGAPNPWVVTPGEARKGAKVIMMHPGDWLEVDTIPVQVSSACGQLETYTILKFKWSRRRQVTGGPEEGGGDKIRHLGWILTPAQ